MRGRQKEKALIALEPHFVVLHGNLAQTFSYSGPESDKFPQVVVLNACVAVASL